MTSDPRIAAKASYSVHNREQTNSPLLISVPHAGREYPREVIENLNVPESNLLRLEDRYVDRLVAPAAQSGITTLIAHRPRAWIDLNRNSTEIDPTMINGDVALKLPQPTRKVRGGLGLIPKRLTGTGNLWRQKWDWQDIATRVENDHEPYHQVIDQQLRRMKTVFGSAILLDIHSMPPLKKGDGSQPQIVIGDRFGKSSSAVYSELTARFFERSGYSVQLNTPYSGGYLLQRHGHPEQDVHAIQIEIDRSCYLDEALREPTQKMAKMAALIRELAELISNEILDRPKLEAAE